MNVAVFARVTEWAAALQGAQALIVDVLLKATLLLVVGLLADLLLRKRTPVACATVWNGVLLALVVLPVAQLCLPKTALFPERSAIREVAALPETTASVVAPLPSTLPLTAEPRRPTITSPYVMPRGRPTPVPARPGAPTIGPSVPRVSPPQDAAPSTPTVAEAPSVPTLSSQEASVAPPPTRSHRLLLLTIASGVYFVGVAIALLRLWAALWAAARLRRVTAPATDDDWLLRLAELQQRMGLGVFVELRVSTAERVPLVVGWCRPAIILPADIVETARPSVRDAVLLHELTHVARRDYAWQLLAKSLQAVLWFHPLLWLAMKRIYFIRERVCDAFSVHGLGGTQPYAEALLQMAGRLTKRPALSLGLAMARSSKLGERLSVIFETGGNSRYCLSRKARTAVLMAACAIAALLGHAAVAQVSVPRQPGLPAEAASALSEYESASNAVLREAQAEVRAQRERLIERLQVIQDQHTRAADLDAAIAVRDQIRALRGQITGVTTLPEFSSYTAVMTPPTTAPPLLDYHAVQAAPADMSAYRSQIGETFVFRAHGSKSGSLWGTDCYTYDSSVATAAVHAGVLADGESGFIRVKVVPGPAAFTGSTRNGVMSQPWDNSSGQYFAFEVSPVMKVDKGAYYAAQSDPGDLSQFAQRFGETLHFRVTGSVGGGVWGTGVYTHDSALATAAVHAGVLGPGQTGVVRVTIQRGPKSFRGSTSHGVTSRDWDNTGEAYSAYRFETEPAPTMEIDNSTWIPGFIPEPLADSGSLTSYRGRNGERFLFQVVGAAGNSIWGTDIYTDDSALATAAVHAGVLKQGETGLVYVTILAGHASYVGSTRNGVASMSYGGFGGSYRIDPAPGLSPGGTGRADDALQMIKGDSLWQLRGRNGESFLCDVVGNQEGDSPALWGTDIYTDDTSLAAAAVHAGLLQDGERGILKVTILPGRSSYRGSTRNGITSRDWSQFDGSFTIERVTTESTRRLSSTTLRTESLDFGTVNISGGTLTLTDRSVSIGADATPVKLDASGYRVYEPGDRIEATTPIKVGDKVLAPWSEKWYSVTVLEILPDDQLKIHWDDWGPVWDGVASRQSLRMFPRAFESIWVDLAAGNDKDSEGRPIYPPGDPIDATTPLKVGDRILAPWSDVWYSVTVLEVLPDEQLQIRWDDWGPQWDEAVSRDTLRMRTRSGRR